MPVSLTSYERLEELDYDLQGCLVIMTKSYAKCKALPLGTEEAGQLLSDVKQRLKWLESCTIVLRSVDSQDKSPSFMALLAAMQDMLSAAVDDFSKGIDQLEDPLGFMPLDTQIVVEKTGMSHLFY